MIGRVAVGLLLALASGCAQAPDVPLAPPADAAFLTRVKAMAPSPERLAIIVEHLRKARPQEAARFDTLEAALRHDEAAAARRYGDRIVVLADARVERAWPASEDAQGMATANVIGGAKKVNRGLRFGPADEARLLAVRGGAPITAACLLIESHLDPAGCILLFD